MDFALADEHAALRKMLRSFFEEEAPTHVIAELDAAQRFPVEIWRKMADLGLCGLTVDEKYGGSAADEISLCIVAEEMSRAGSSLAYAYIPTVTFCARAVQQFGTDEQKNEILPKIAAGDLQISLSLTEAQVGSDLAGLATTAVRDGDDYIVNGHKTFTTGADTSDYLLTFVRTNTQIPATKGMSVLLIPRTTPGLTIRPLRKIAGQAVHTCEIFLDDVRVSGNALLGELDHGASILFALLNGERIALGAHGVGIAQGALDLALKHACQREQFGQPVADFQAVGHMLADMAMDIEAARLLVYQAAWKKQNGLPHSMDASMAKVRGSEAGSRCAGRGMEIIGGGSYLVDFGMERYYREAKLYEIAGGSNQIQRNMILKYLREPAKQKQGSR